MVRTRNSLSKKKSNEDDADNINQKSSGCHADENKSSSCHAEKKKSSSCHAEETCDNKSSETQTQLPDSDKPPDDTGNSGSFQCYECAATFQQFPDLKSHLAEHDQCTPFICNHCGTGFISSVQYVDHKRRTDNLEEEMLFNCDICTKGFMTKYLLNLHKEGHKNANFLTCSKCDKTFSSDMSAYLRHCHKHESKEAKRATNALKNQKPRVPVCKEAVFSCSVCNLKYKSPSLLFVHLKSHAGSNQTFICFQCGTGFDDLAEHTRKAHKKKHNKDESYSLYQCKICNDRFLNLDLLQLHENVHLKQNLYECYACHKSFNNGFNLYFHLYDPVVKCKVISNGNQASIESSNTNFDVGSFDNDGDYGSPISCLELSLYNSTGSNGLLEKYRKDVFRCDYCEQEFKTFDKLFFHLQAHGYKKFDVCSACGLGVKTELQLMKHKLYHNSQNEHFLYQCNICDMEFLYFDLLKLHVNVVHKGKPLLFCEKCDQGFDSKANYLHHFGSEMHISKGKEKADGPEKRRQIDCKFCPKRFDKRKARDVHVTSYHYLTCHICKEKFDTSGELNNHKKDHVDDYPFKCQFCGNIYGDEQTFLHHINIHIKRQDKGCHVCTICTRQYQDQEKLEEHKGQHLYKFCTNCGRKQGYEIDLLDHYRKCKSGKIESDSDNEKEEVPKKRIYKKRKKETESEIKTIYVEGLLEPIYMKQKMQAIEIRNRKQKIDLGNESDEIPFEDENNPCSSNTGITTEEMKNQNEANVESTGSALYMQNDKLTPALQEKKKRLDNIEEIGERSVHQSIDNMIKQNEVSSRSLVRQNEQKGNSVEKVAAFNKCEVTHDHDISERVKEAMKSIMNQSMDCSSVKVTENRTETEGLSGTDLANISTDNKLNIVSQKPLFLPLIKNGQIQCLYQYQLPDILNIQKEKQISTVSSMPVFNIQKEKQISTVSNMPVIAADEIPLSVLPHSQNLASYKEIPTCGKSEATPRKRKASDIDEQGITGYKVQHAKYQETIAHTENDEQDVAITETLYHDKIDDRGVESELNLHESQNRKDLLVSNQKMETSDISKEKSSNTSMNLSIESYANDQGKPTDVSKENASDTSHNKSIDANEQDIEDKSEDVCKDNASDSGINSSIKNEIDIPGNQVIKISRKRNLPNFKVKFKKSKKPCKSKKRKVLDNTEDHLTVSVDTLDDKTGVFVSEKCLAECTVKNTDRIIYEDQINDKEHEDLDVDEDIEISLDEEEKKVFSCGHCHVKFTKYNHLVVHLFSFHRGAKPFICQTCGCGYLCLYGKRLREKIVNDHLKTHENEKFAYKCNQANCLQEFRNKILRNRHLKVDHGNESPLICDLCDKRFSKSVRPSAYVSHYRDCAKRLLALKLDHSNSNKNQFEKEKQTDGKSSRILVDTDIQDCSTVMDDTQQTTTNYEENIQSLQIHDKLKDMSTDKDEANYCDINKDIEIKHLDTETTSQSNDFTQEDYVMQAENTLLTDFNNTDKKLASLCKDDDDVLSRIKDGTNVQEVTSNGERKSTRVRKVSVRMINYKSNIKSKGHKGSKVQVPTEKKQMDIEKIKEKIPQEKCFNTKNENKEQVTHTDVEKKNNEPNELAPFNQEIAMKKANYLLEEVEKLFSLTDLKDLGIKTTQSETSKGEGNFLCEICNKRFTSYQILYYHLTDHKGTSPTICLTCGVGNQLSVFKAANWKKHHERIHLKEEMSHSCKTCGEKFAQSEFLDLHEKRHRGKEIICCEHCGKDFPIGGLYLNHIKNKLCPLLKTENSVSENKMEIKRSKVDLTNENDKEENIYNTKKQKEQDKEKKPLQGIRKERRIITEQKMRKFKQLNDKFSKARKTLAQLPVQNGIQCFVCKRFLKFKSYICEHSKNHKYPNAYICQICGKIMKTKVLLTQHIQRKHSSSSFPCRICGSTFGIISDLKKHMILSHDANPIHLNELINDQNDELIKDHAYLEKMDNVCVITDKTRYVCNFQSLVKDEQNVNLLSNVNNISSIQQTIYTATELQTSNQVSDIDFNFNNGYMTEFPPDFSDVSKAKDYIIQHDNRNICKLCGKIIRSRRPYIWKLHLLSQHGEKKHICSICNAGFGIERTLKIHIKYAHQIRKTCQFCDKSFSHRGLEKHLKTMHNYVLEKRIKCLHCPEVFQSIASRKNHVDIFHSKFKCDICGQFLSSSRGLRKHKERIHQKITNKDLSHKNDYFVKSVANNIEEHRNMETLEAVSFVQNLLQDSPSKTVQSQHLPETNNPYVSNTGKKTNNSMALKRSLLQSQMVMKSPQSRSSLSSMKFVSKKNSSSPKSGQRMSPRGKMKPVENSVSSCLNTALSPSRTLRGSASSLIYTPLEISSSFSENFDQPIIREAEAMPDGDDMSKICKNIEDATATNAVVEDDCDIRTDEFCVCDTCGRFCLSESHLAKHKRESHDIRIKLNCNFCGTVVNTVKEASCHRNKYHKKIKYNSWCFSEVNAAITSPDETKPSLLNVDLHMDSQDLNIVRNLEDIKTETIEHGSVLEEVAQNETNSQDINSQEKQIGNILLENRISLIDKNIKEKNVENMEYEDEDEDEEMPSLNDDWDENDDDNDQHTFLDENSQSYDDKGNDGDKAKEGESLYTATLVDSSLEEIKENKSIPIKEKVERPVKLIEKDLQNVSVDVVKNVSTSNVTNEQLPKETKFERFSKSEKCFPVGTIVINKSLDKSAFVTKNVLETPSIGREMQDTSTTMLVPKDASSLKYQKNEQSMKQATNEKEKVAMVNSMEDSNIQSNSAENCTQTTVKDSLKFMLESKKQKEEKKTTNIDINECEQKEKSTLKNNKPNDNTQVKKLTQDSSIQCEPIVKSMKNPFYKKKSSAVEDEIEELEENNPIEGMCNKLVQTERTNLLYIEEEKKTRVKPKRIMCKTKTESFIKRTCKTYKQVLENCPVYRLTKPETKLENIDTNVENNETKVENNETKVEKTIHKVVDVPENLSSKFRVRIDLPENSDEDHNTVVNLPEGMDNMDIHLVNLDEPDSDVYLFFFVD